MYNIECVFYSFIYFQLVHSGLMQKCFFFLIVKNIAFMRLMKKQILPSVSFIPFDLSLFINLLFFRFFFHLMEKNNNNEDSSATMIITG